MLRVTLEIVPHGDERRASVLGRLLIANIGGDNERAAYEWRLDDGKPHGKRQRGEVRRWVRARGAWALVRRVLGKVPEGMLRG